MSANQNKTYARPAQKKSDRSSNVAVVGIGSRPDAKPRMELLRELAATESAAAKKNEGADAKLGVAGETWKKFTAAQKKKDPSSMTVEVGKPSGKVVFKIKQ